MNNNKHLTPLQSIRKYCLWCSNEQPKEIRSCPKTDCCFYPFRMRKKTIKGSLIKVIRCRCFDCDEGTAQVIRKCKSFDCPLYLFRNGKSPAHQKLWQNRRLPHGFSKKAGLPVQEINKMMV